MCPKENMTGPSAVVGKYHCATDARFQWTGMKHTTTEQQDIVNIAFLRILMACKDMTL